MKKYAILLLFAFVSFSPSLYAKTLVVRELGRNGANSSIQSALLKAVANDTILVDLGRFSCWQEDFQINFPVIIRNFSGSSLKICGNIALNVSDSSTVYFSGIVPKSISSLNNLGKVVLDSVVWKNIIFQSSELSIFHSTLDSCGFTSGKLNAAGNIIKNTTLNARNGIRFCGNDLNNSTVNSEIYERSFILGNKGLNASFTVNSYGKFMEFASNYMVNPSLGLSIGGQYLDTLILFQIFNNNFTFTNLDNKWGYCVPIGFNGNQKNMLVANNYFVGSGNSSSFNPTIYSGPSYPNLCKWSSFEKRCLYNNYFSVTCVGTNSTYQGSITNSQNANGLVEFYDSLSATNYFTAYRIVNDSLNLGRLISDSNFTDIGIDLPEFSDVNLSRNDIGPSGGPYPIEDFWDTSNGKAKVFWVELPRKTMRIPNQIKIKAQAGSK